MALRTATNSVRYMLFASALVFGLIALGISALVIPPVLADTFPQAMPERAAKAFAVPVGLDIMFALMVFFIARRLSHTSSGRGWILASLGAVASVVNLVLLDAAGALSGHGPHMATVAGLLFVLAVMGFLAGILLIVSAVLRRRRLNSARSGEPPYSDSNGHGQDVARQGEYTRTSAFA